MALKVWLPLNGNLENKGVSDLTVTNNGATVDNNGKIGKCYSFDGTDDRIYSTAANLNNQEASYACWVKITSYKQYGFIFSLGDVKANASQMSCYIHHTNHNVYICCNGSELNSGFLMPLNEWHHLCFTYKNTESKLYVDGTLRYTGTNAGSYKTSHNLTLGARSNSANGAGNSFYYPMEGYLNDFRLYDHCLSAKEVKEISQGLVLHYKLDNPSIANYFESGNLIPNYREMNLGSANVSTGTWRLAGTSNMTRTRIQITDSPVGTCYCFQNSGIQTANDGSCYGIDSTTYFEPNTEYRISMFARITSGTEGYAGYNIYNISSELGGSHMKIDKNYRVTSLNSDGSWTYCWYHIKTNSSTTRNIYIGITTGETSATTQMCLVRIEKWNEGMNNSIITDSSGYGNDGIINGNLITNNNTSKYFSSTFFDGNTAAIKIPFNNIIKDKNYTVSCWTYKTTIGTKNYQTILGGPSGFELEARSSSSTSPLYRIHNWGGGTTPYEFNKWNHFCFVHTDVDSKLYVNGELKITGTSANIPTGNYFIGSWSTATSQNYEGQMSDFRLYTTALSAEDILDLYHTSANIDNLGGIHGFEMVEDGDKQNINEKGQVVNNGNTKTYLVNNFSETNSMTDWSFGGSPTISNGVVTMTGVNPAFNSSNFTVNPNDIIVVEFDIQMPTISTTTSGPGVYIGTPTGSANSVTQFSYNFTTQSWTVGSTNNTNPYFMNSYNSTDYYHCRTYLLGSNRTIDDLPPAEATNTRTLYALKLNSATTAKIRSGYNSNTTMTIKLSNFKIYKLDNEGFCETDDIAKVGKGYYQATQFIEK